jgi:hypothetical protein
MFLLPLLGSGIPAYIVALLFLFYRLTTIRFKIEDVFFLGAIVLWLIIKCQQSDVQASIVLFRFYFGFYIFYLFFNNIDTEIDTQKLLLIISVAVLIEAVLINTVINPEWLPNFPKSNLKGDLAFETKILGFYQRPYSIGTNSTITSTLIMVLLFYNHTIYQKIQREKFRTTTIIAIIAVVILGSGTGYVLLILYFVYRTNPFKNGVYTSISVLLLFIIYYLLFIVNIGSIDGLEKISSVYFDFLYDYKMTQIDDVKRILFSDDTQLYFGQKFDDTSELVIWSDFAWNNLLLCTGIIGISVTVVIFIFKTNRYNIIPVLIFVIGAIHYGAMFSLPGQLLLGYFLSSKFKAMMQTKIGGLNSSVSALA